MAAWDNYDGIGLLHGVDAITASSIQLEIDEGMLYHLCGKALLTDVEGVAG